MHSNCIKFFISPLQIINRHHKQEYIKTEAAQKVRYMCIWKKQTRKKLTISAPGFLVFIKMKGTLTSMFAVTGVILQDVNAEILKNCIKWVFHPVHERDHTDRGRHTAPRTRMLQRCWEKHHHDKCRENYFKQQL